jgi:hypothetical protein
MKTYSLLLALLAVISFTSSGCAGPEKPQQPLAWTREPIVVNIMFTNTSASTTTSTALTPQPAPQAAKPVRPAVEPETIGHPMRTTRPGEPVPAPLDCPTNKPPTAAVHPLLPQPAEFKTTTAASNYYGGQLVIQGALLFPHPTQPQPETVVAPMPVEFGPADNDPGGYYINIPNPPGTSSTVQRRVWVPYRGTLEHQVSPDRSWGSGGTGNGVLRRPRGAVLY